MERSTNLALSHEEQVLVENAAWVVMKRGIMEKGVGLFSELSERMKGLIASKYTNLPDLIRSSEPKIYKGENYCMLPYVLLDYPKYFSKADIFVIRTMFWWGNFFSITLQLSGCFKTAFEGVIVGQYQQLDKHAYYLCVNTDPWQHHFGQDNYRSLEAMTADEIKGILYQRPFIKIARKYALEQWNEMPGMLEDAFKVMLEMLSFHDITRMLIRE